MGNASMTMTHQLGQLSEVCADQQLAAPAVESLEPRRLVRDVLLRDGSTLRLEAATPADFEDIKAFYDGLSPESRYLRFHGYARTDIAARGGGGGLWR